MGEAIITLSRTDRGFAVGEFRDHYNKPCSIQESSAAEPACIWLGTEDARMHLTQGQADEAKGGEHGDD